MHLLNFSHPLTAAQLQDLQARLQTTITVTDIKVQFAVNQPFEPQLATLMASVPLSAEAWQTDALLINLPSLNYISALLLADLHGRMGYFPTVIRLRPVENSTPPRFEVAELLALQAQRNLARGQR